MFKACKQFKIPKSSLKIFSIFRNLTSGSFLSRTKPSRSSKTRRLSSPPHSPRLTRRPSGPSRVRRSSRGSRSRLRSWRMRTRRWPSTSWPSRSPCTRTWASTPSPATTCRPAPISMSRVSRLHCVRNLIRFERWLFAICQKLAFYWLSISQYHSVSFQLATMKGNLLSNVIAYRCSNMVCNPASIFERRKSWQRFLTSIDSIYGFRVIGSIWKLYSVYLLIY